MKKLKIEAIFGAIFLKVCELFGMEILKKQINFDTNICKNV